METHDQLPGDPLLQEGIANLKAGKTRQAIRACQRLLEKNPYDKSALALFCAIAEGSEKSPKGVRPFERAFWLANHYMGRQSNALAERYYQQALTLQPKHFGALRNYASVAHALGKYTLSAELNNQAFSLNPHYEVLIEMALSLPMVYDSIDEMARVRVNFIRNLDSLLAEDIRLIRPMERFTCWPAFFMAYQGGNDREIQRAIDAFFRKALLHPPYEPPPPHEKPRIGFLSRHLTQRHTIGKLTSGLIERLPRDRFDVTLFYLDDNYDANPMAHETITENARHVRLPYRELYSSARIIADKQLDALIYTDIGMDPCSYLLSQFRLARVQCALWGHPVTTGVETMDYYISSRLIEPDDCADHYSERLVLMDTLPCYYYQPDPERIQLKTRADFGYDENDRLYLCPQSIFKIHPDFDAVLDDILRRDPEGKILLLRDASDYNNDKLAARLSRTLGERMARVCWVERQKLGDFMALMALADVMLDPPHFGGGNTTYEAIAMGAPIVTWPGPFMRGRVTYGCYQKIGMTETVAHTLEEYAPLAVAIATNRDLRDSLRQKTLDRRRLLFEDEAAVAEFVDFLEMALAGAANEASPQPEAMIAHG